MMALDLGDSVCKYGQLHLVTNIPRLLFCRVSSLPEVFSWPDLLITISWNAGNDLRKLTC